MYIHIYIYIYIYTYTYTHIANKHESPTFASHRSSVPHPFYPIRISQTSHVHARRGPHRVCPQRVLSSVGRASSQSATPGVGSPGRISRGRNGSRASRHHLTPGLRFEDLIAFGTRSKLSRGISYCELVEGLKSNSEMCAREPHRVIQSRTLLHEEHTFIKLVENKQRSSPTWLRGGPVLPGPGPWVGPAAPGFSIPGPGVRWAPLAARVPGRLAARPVRQPGRPAGRRARPRRRCAHARPSRSWSGCGPQGCTLEAVAEG